MVSAPVLGCRDGERYRRETGTPPIPDLMFENVSEAVDFILEYRATRRSRNRLYPTFNECKRCVGAGRSVRTLSGGKVRAAHAIVRALTEDGVRLPPCSTRRLDRAGG